VSTEPGPPDAEGLQEPLDRLAEAAPRIVEELHRLGRDSGDQFVSLAQQDAENSARIRRLRRFNWTLAASVLLDIVLSVVLTVGLVQLDDNTHRISALTDRLNVSQTTTRKDTLCPLYTLLLSGDTAAARQQSVNKVQFDHSFAVISAGYKALGCTAVVSKAVPLPSLAP
jgi:hypothetical protein